MNYATLWKKGGLALSSFPKNAHTPLRFCLYKAPSIFLLDTVHLGSPSQGKFLLILRNHWHLVVHPTPSFFWCGIFSFSLHEKPSQRLIFIFRDWLGKHTPSCSCEKEDSKLATIEGFCYAICGPSINIGVAVVVEVDWRGASLVEDYHLSGLRFATLKHDFVYVDLSRRRERREDKRGLC